MANFMGVLSQIIECLFQSLIIALSNAPHVPKSKPVNVINSEKWAYHLTSCERVSWSKINVGEGGVKTIYNSIKIVF